MDIVYPGCVNIYYPQCMDTLHVSCASCVISDMMQSDWFSLISSSSWKSRCLFQLNCCHSTAASSSLCCLSSVSLSVISHLQLPHQQAEELTLPPGSQWGAEQTLQLFELVARHGEYLYTRTTGFVDNVASTCGSLEGAHGVRRLITEVIGY